jgi:glutamate dehydrogenase (NAD(P)+)
MAWVYDTYSMMHPGQNNLPVVTGKPLDLAGSQGRETATAQGLFYVFEHMLTNGAFPSLGSIGELEIAVQGFGNAGRNAARIFKAADAKIVAVSDSKGGVYNPDGLDLSEIEAHKKETGSVIDSPGTKPLAPGEVLEVPCDVLIPAAMELQLTAENAARVQAKVVIEAANGPTTPAADDILSENSIHVVPDILSAAGGVVVSYFEWVQNLANEQWDEAEVHRRLKEKMAKATDAVITTRVALIDRLEFFRNTWKAARPDDGELPRPTYRTAAHVVAVQRCRRAMEQRGVWP